MDNFLLTIILIIAIISAFSLGYIKGLKINLIKSFNYDPIKKQQARKPEKIQIIKKHTPQDNKQETINKITKL